MKLNPIVLVSICVAMTAIAPPAIAISDDVPIRSEDDATLLRHFALAHCISLAYADEATRNDAQAVASAYVEFGNVNDSDAYLHVADLAKAWLARTYPSKSGSDLKLMKCIDFHGSDQLTETIEKYTQ